MVLSQLAPEVAALEARRSAIRSATAQTLVTAVVVAAATTLLVWASGLLGSFGRSNWLVVGILIAAITFFVLYHWVVGAKVEVFEHQFKTRVIGRLVDARYPGARYAPREGIDIDAFRSTRLFRTGIDRYRSEDLVEGHSGATRFRIAEVHAAYKTTSTDERGRETTEWHSIFQGTICFADFNKHFRGVTLVQPDTAERLLGHLGQQLQRLGAIGDLDLVALEDVDFEREFVVYGTDQVEARYILSLGLMQRLRDLRRQLGGDLRVAFVDENVVVAVEHVTDRFEPPSVWRSEPVLLRRDVDTYLAQIRLAADIVEGLNLNTRIWSKP